MKFTYFILFLIILLACQEKKTFQLEASAETQKTIHVLDSIYSKEDVGSNISRNSEKVPLKKEEYLASTENRSRIYLEYIMELTHAGMYNDALQNLQSTFPNGQISVDHLNKKTKSVFELLAHGYLMLGVSKQNKAIRLPVSSDQFHQNPEFINAAKAFYQVLYEKFPNDKQYLWPLHLCHMLQGSYPNGLAPDQRLPLLEKLNNPSPTTFKDITALSRINEKSNGGGAAFMDLDGDHDLDIVTTSHPLTKSIKTYFNTNGKFTESSDSVGLKNLTGGYRIAPADYDNDGDIDFLIARGSNLFMAGQQPNSLVRNNGDGTFDDIGVLAGLTRQLPTTAALWNDFDHDGDLDIITQSTKTKVALPTYMYMNNGDGTFEDKAKEDFRVQNKINGSSALWTDYDNDGWQDLMTFNIVGYNSTYKNINGALNMKDDLLVNKHNITSAALAFDFDNDGDQDILVCSSGSGEKNAITNFTRELIENIGPRNHLYLNDGEGNFTLSDVIGDLEYVGNVTGVASIDIDNDGFLDIYLTTGGLQNYDLLPNRLFLNENGKGIKDITYQSGLGVVSKSSAISIGDLDRDGDSDVFIKGGGLFSGATAQSLLLENTLDNDNHWISIQLIGVLNNRQGIGCKIEIEGFNDDDEEVSIFRYVDPGTANFTQDLRTPIGLGSMSKITNLYLTWPRGQEQTFSNIEVDQSIVIQEDKDILVGEGDSNK